jgi:FKBP-type peptidyl-prolyl cis-trans isomerase FkpA
MRRLFLLLVCALPLFAAACGSDGPTSIEDTEFAPNLGVDLSAMTRTSTGLYYRDAIVGTGALAQSNSRVSMHYRGWLADGTLFANGAAPQPPLGPFVLGTGYVIKGWDQGIPGMRVGGIRQLVIPPSLAYGAEGRGSIPPNSVLVFEVSLVSVQ